MTPKASFRRKRVRVFGSFMMLLALAFGPGSAFQALAAMAQENSGSIQGQVKDQTGAVIPGAKITATSPNLVRPMEATSDSGGAYRFSTVPVGMYTVTVTQSGFK